MALDPNNYTDAFDAFTDMLSRLSSTTNNTIFDMVDSIKQFEELFKNFPISEIKEIKETFGDANADLRIVFDRIISQYEEQIDSEAGYIDKVNSLKEDIDVINNALSTANEEDREYLENKKALKESEITELEDERRVKREGRQKEEALNAELEQQRKERQQTSEREAEEAEKAARDRATQIRNQSIDFVANLLSDVTKQITNMIKQSVSNVVNEYEKDAGTLSAALNSSVDNISNLQHKIADELRDTSLSKAISNVAVLSEATNLANSGYTNQDKLQENATAIAIAKEISPNLDTNNGSFKYLTNILGADFANRISAIQAASQETAGSALGIKETIGSMLTSLEPVFQNAEYENLATQDLSDIQATLAAAQESGQITEAQKNEYTKMIVELMDPSKAFTSNSVAVRVAAQNYDFGSGSPMEALQALLDARRQMYSGIGMGNSYSDNLSRNLAASVYGDDTMSAMYMPSGLYGLDIKQTRDLDTIYDEQLDKLKEGDYTTQKEREANTLDNSSMTQGIADIQKWLPATYATFSSTLFNQLNTMPLRIAAALKASDFLVGLFGGKGGAGGVAGSSGAGGILSSPFFTGAGGGSSALGRLGSGFNMGMYALGVAGTMNTVGQWDKDRSLVQNLGHGGDTASSMLSWAGTGAGVGALVGSFFPGAGNLIGAGIGAAVGAIGGLVTSIMASNELEEEANTLRQQQIQNTRDILGQGVTQVSALEAKNEIARGGGIAHLTDGDYAIDYQKSTYPGFASGLAYVPHDDFVARLHKGESVVTAEAAEQLRKQNPNFWNVPKYEDNDVVGALKEQTDSIVNAVRGDVDYKPLVQAQPKTYTIPNNA